MTRKAVNPLAPDDDRIHLQVNGSTTLSINIDTLESKLAGLQRLSSFVEELIIGTRVDILKRNGSNFLKRPNIEKFMRNSKRNILRNILMKSNKLSKKSRMK